jgi:hypothetical protein
MKNKLKPFSVCHSGLIVGELFKAIDINDLLENRLPKRVLNNWEIISFVDSENRNINITKEFMDDGMTLNEVIQDWIENGDIDEPIIALNPNNLALTKGISVTLSEFSFQIN